MPVRRNERDEVEPDKPHDPTQKAEAALRSITGESPDDDVANRIADYLFAVAQPQKSPPRFRFGVEHDPTSGPCPVQNDVAVAREKLCLIERDDPVWCRTWVVAALLKGMTVVRVLDSGCRNVRYSSNVATARDRAVRMARLKDEPYDDDEVPF